MLKDVPDIGTVRDKGDDAHLPTAQRAQKREHLVDAGNQHRPQARGPLSRRRFRQWQLAGRMTGAVQLPVASGRRPSPSLGWTAHSRDLLAVL